jgi:hypothetical protein
MSHTPTQGAEILTAPDYREAFTAAAGLFSKDGRGKCTFAVVNRDARCVSFLTEDRWCNIHRARHQMTTPHVTVSDAGARYMCSAESDAHGLLVEFAQMPQALRDLQGHLFPAELTCAI